MKTGELESAMQAGTDEVVLSTPTFSMALRLWLMPSQADVFAATILNRILAVAMNNEQWPQLTCSV